MKWNFIIFISINLYSLCYSVSVEDELTLTQNQKSALDKLKQEVAGKLTKDYMYKEIYLIKWLRFQDFNVDAAKNMILKSMEWRKENKIDDILTEDMSHLHYDKLFPFWLDGRDFADRPVGSADVSVWDVRPVSLTRSGEKLHRYAIKVLESALFLIREDQKNGKNVTQFTLLLNLDGFNFIQHSCLRCVSFYIKFLVDIDQNYPGLLHKIYLMNTPAAFDVLYRMVRPMLNQKLAQVLFIYGYNKKQWQKDVLSEIPEDQIRPQFGGTKQDPEDY